MTTSFSPADPPILVAVHTQDPLSKAGLISHLRPYPEVRLLGPDDHGPPQVAVVVAETVDEPTLRLMRQLHRTSAPAPGGVLVITDTDEQHVLLAAEAGFTGIVRRAQASPDRLVNVIKGVHAGHGQVPPDLLGTLLGQVHRLQRQATGGIHFSGFTDREIEVLRLAAEGLDTATIARKLAYTERTIKNIVQAVLIRHHLNNRTHAVAYALREGVI